MPASSSTGTGAPPLASLAFACLMAVGVIVALWLVPASGIAPGTMTGWHDQSIFLRAAVQTIEQGLPDATNRALVGPAYVGLTVALASIFGITPEAALMLLSRLTFVACAGILSFIALRDRAQSGPAMQFVLVAVGLLGLCSSVWFRVLDVPWTHFVAAALLGTIVLVSLSRLPLAVRSTLIGALFVVLYQTRTFEALVTLVAAGLIVPLAALRQWRALRGNPGGTLGRSALHVGLPVLAGAAAGFVAVGLLSHNWALYQQYDDQQGMVLTPLLAPIKAVQLFWDTCFATVCDYAPLVTVSPLADSLEAWHQPLLLQLPGLGVAAAGLLVLLLLRPVRTLQLPLGLWFAALVASGIILAYVSGAPSGSPHLKYGFFRDFIAPLMLLTCAFVAALANQRAADGRWSVPLLVPLAVYFGLAIALIALRPLGLPAIADAHVGRFTIASTCVGGTCSFSLTALGADGRAIPYNDLAYVQCEGQRLEKPVQRVSALRLAAAACPQAGILPLASGLLYTPEGDEFFNPGLDLGIAADSLTLPPAP